MSANKISLPFRRPGWFSLLALSLTPALFAGPARAQTTPAAKPAPDVLILTDGEELTGTLERGVGSNLTFKSDTVGEVTVPAAKVKEFRSMQHFIVLKNKEKIKRVHRAPGSIAFEDNAIELTTANGAPEKIADSDIAYIVDEATFDKEINQNPGFLSGWNGSITGSAAVVRATQNSVTYNIGTSLVRAVPSVPYLPPRTKDSFNLSETYGKLTQPAIAITNTPASEIKTDIFHTDFEHDRYFTQRLFAFGGLSYDHNYSLGLQLQQIYGGGIGWTAILDPRQELDLKADIHYERQTFIQPVAGSGLAPIPGLNLIGTTFSDVYHRNLPGKIVFNEAASFIPSWNDTNAYSAIATAGVTLPTYKRLAVSLNVQDNYINNPPIGFNKNSFQFLAGLTYTLH
jgi:Protein of unknown function, DUF481